MTGLLTLLSVFEKERENHNSLENMSSQQLLKNCCSYSVPEAAVSELPSHGSELLWVDASTSFACFPLPVLYPEKIPGADLTAPKHAQLPAACVCPSWGTPAQHSAGRRALTSGLSLRFLSAHLAPTLTDELLCWTVHHSFERAQLCTSQITKRKINWQPWISLSRGPTRINTEVIPPLRDFSPLHLGVTVSSFDSPLKAAAGAGMTLHLELSNAVSFSSYKNRIILILSP